MKLNYQFQHIFFTFLIFRGGNFQHNISYIPFCKKELLLALNSLDEGVKDSKDHLKDSKDLGIYSKRLFNSDFSITLISQELMPPMSPKDFSISLMCQSIRSLILYGRSPIDGLSFITFLISFELASAFFSLSSQTVMTFPSFLISSLKEEFSVKIAFLSFSLFFIYSQSFFFSEKIALISSTFLSLRDKELLINSRMASELFVVSSQSLCLFIQFSFLIKAYCDSKFSSIYRICSSVLQNFLIKSVALSCETFVLIFFGNMTDSPSTSQLALCPFEFSISISSFYSSTRDSPMLAIVLVRNETSSLCFSTSLSNFCIRRFRTSSIQVISLIFFSRFRAFALFSLSSLYSLSLMMTSQSYYDILIRLIKEYMI